jgi:hypothetical protein
MALIRPSTPGMASVAAVLFGAVGAFAFWLGMLDSLSAANFQYKLIGLAFAIAGLTMLTGSAVLARKPWRYTHGRVTTVAACVAGVFIGGYLLLMQYRAPGLSPSRVPPFPAWVPWAAIVVASVAAGVLGWRSTKDHVADQVTWTAISGRLFAGGLSVTVLFGGVQWWYSQQYKPGTIAAALTVTTELRPAPAMTEENVGETSDPHMYEGTITIENVSDTKVQVVASLFQVTTATYDLRKPIPGINQVDEQRQAVACFLEELAPVTDPECDEPGIYEYGQFSAGDPRAQDDFSISRTSRLASSQTLQLGHVVGDGSWLEPAEELQHNLVVHVPEHEESSESPNLRELHLSAWLAVAQGSRLVLERAPSHGPEMVPQALMSNEEYRDYKEAQARVQRDGVQDEAGADRRSSATDETVEVDSRLRDAYYQQLTTQVSSTEAALPVEAKSKRSPRPYPHRYTVVEWPIEDLSTLHRLVWGSHAVNTVQVLSKRLYDPEQSLLREVELGEMATCITPAGTLEGKTEESEIRRDPTAVCPGAWYSLADGDGHLSNDYERRYEGNAEYGEDMAGFFGLIATASSDVVSLTTAAEAVAAAAAMPMPPQFHRLPSEVFRQCEPALQQADLLTRGYGGVEGYSDTMQRAVDEPAAATMQHGLQAASQFGRYVDGANAALSDCTRRDAPPDTPAASCIKAAAAEIRALQHAQDLRSALEDAEAAGTLPDGGSDASQAYRLARDEAEALMAECR